MFNTSTPSSRSATQGETKARRPNKNLLDERAVIFELSRDQKCSLAFSKPNILWPYVLSKFPFKKFITV